MKTTSLIFPYGEYTTFRSLDYLRYVYIYQNKNNLKWNRLILIFRPTKAIEYAKKCGLNASKLNSLSVNPALRNKSNENKTELPWNSNRQMLPTIQESHLHLHVVHVSIHHTILYKNVPTLNRKIHFYHMVINFIFIQINSIKYKKIQSWE